MEKNNKTLLIAVLIMLLALVSLNFNKISGRATDSDSSHALTLRLDNNDCNLGTQVGATLSGDLGATSHDPSVKIRVDGSVVSTDELSGGNVQTGYISERLYIPCTRSGIVTATVSGRRGDHDDVAYAGPLTAN